MTHMIEIERHQVVRVAYETNDEEFTNNSKEIKEAIEEGIFDPFNGDYELTVDVMNICDKFDPLVWVQTKNLGNGENTTKITSLKKIYQTDILEQLPEETIVKLNNPEEVNPY